MGGMRVLGAGVLVLVVAAARADPVADACDKGMEAIKKGEPEKALAHFEKALDLDPKRVQARYGRGLVRLQTGAPDKALSDFDEALRLEPGNVALLVARGGLLTEMKQYDRALADLDRA